jgi:hypothetical protein
MNRLTKPTLIQPLILSTFIAQPGIGKPWLYSESVYSTCDSPLPELPLSSISQSSLGSLLRKKPFSFLATGNLPSNLGSALLKPLSSWCFTVFLFPLVPNQELTSIPLSFYPLFFHDAAAVLSLTTKVNEKALIPDLWTSKACICIFQFKVEKLC